jgi:hypothetical protein
LGIRIGDRPAAPAGDNWPANYRPGCLPLQANRIVNGRPLYRAQNLRPSLNRASEQSPASHPNILGVAHPTLARPRGGGRGWCLPRCFGREGLDRPGSSPGPSPAGLVARRAVATLAAGTPDAGTPALRHAAAPAWRVPPTYRRMSGVVPQAAVDLQSRPGRDTFSSEGSHNASGGIRLNRKVPGCSGASRSVRSGLNQSIGLP